ncbi:hypothetical protein Hanom_Chr15g01387531 [Helianthus anomalus]
MVHLIGWQSDRMTIRSSVLHRERASDWDKSHNICRILDAHYTDTTPFEEMEKFLRESVTPYYVITQKNDAAEL